MRPPEFLRSTTFRWALAVAGAFALALLLLFGFVYWQTAVYITGRIDRLIADEATSVSTESTDQAIDSIDKRLRDDPRRIKLGGLFAQDGRRLAGNVAAVPSDLVLDGRPRSARIERMDNRGREVQTVRAVGRRLENGEVLVIGRDADEIAEVREIVERALGLGLAPGLILAVAAGAFLSARAQRRIAEVNSRVRRIVAGDLRERLPTRGLDDPFDKLAAIVNDMLDEIEELVHEVAGVGDDIAHDLRTPLTRVRAALERGRDNARTLADLQAVVDRAVDGLDQTMAIITALLRIAEIEHGHRLAGFGSVELAGLVREVGELYEPIAEDRNVALAVAVVDVPPVQGDRDLLFEAVANLVDNAVKFTPAGGRVDLTVADGAAGAVVRVTDTGPGIAEAERANVLKRFYRSDKSRSTRGVGLGLSLVAAIAKLHGFQLTIAGGPGCIVELACSVAPGA